MKIHQLSGISLLLLLLVGGTKCMKNDGEDSQQNKQQKLGNKNTSGIPFINLSTTDENESSPSPNSLAGESQDVAQPRENIDGSGTYGASGAFNPLNYAISSNEIDGSSGFLRSSHGGYFQPVNANEFGHREQKQHRAVAGQKRSANEFESRQEEVVGNLGKGKKHQGSEATGTPKLLQKPTTDVNWGDFLIDFGKKQMTTTGGSSKPGGQPPPMPIKVHKNNFQQLVQQLTGQPKPAPRSGQLRIADSSNPIMNRADADNSSRGIAPLYGTSDDGQGKDQIIHHDQGHHIVQHQHAIGHHEQGQLIHHDQSHHIVQHQDTVTTGSHGQGAAAELYGMLHRLLVQNQHMIENATQLYNKKKAVLERQQQAVLKSLTNPLHIATQEELLDFDCGYGNCPSCDKYLCLAFGHICSWNDVTDKCQ